MTFVGKILVIVIMAFALLFLGISTVVFTTHTNWKDATGAQKKKVDELSKKNNDLNASLEVAKNDLAKAQSDHKAATDTLEKRVAALEAEFPTSFIYSPVWPNYRDVIAAMLETVRAYGLERLAEAVGVDLTTLLERAERLGVNAPRLLVLAETDLTQILAQIEDSRADLVVVDSIQTVYRPDLPGAPGTVGQIRECTGDLLRVAKTEGGPAILIVGHVTKEGAIAGPRVLEHMVDAVLYFEGDRGHQFRILRAVKNRFGATDEIGVFEMRDSGMHEVSDPSRAFLQDRSLSEVGNVVHVALEGSRPLLDGLKDYLREKQLLLLLDNFEQIISAAPVVELLMIAPALKVLVTSRASLHLSGEHEFVVPPLSLPDLRDLPSLDHLAHFEAVHLFVERAQAVKSDFAMTRENAPAIAAICQQVDGLPLAIELAAGRSKLFSPQALLPRLRNRLNLLVGGAQDLPLRQQTLRGTIAWSYDLLDQDEKLLFRRLAVFVGGCTLEAAESVCNAHGDLDTLDGVARLVDKSLLRQEEQADSEPHFLMLETIREYALECLAESGEVESMRRQHATFFLQLAEEADPKVRSAEQATWYRRLEVEHDNLRAALRWTIERQESEMSLRLAGALWAFWRQHLHEGRGWLEQVLAQPGAKARTTARAKALLGAGALAFFHGDFLEAHRLLEESVSIGREVGAKGKRNLAHALMMLGHMVLLQGNLSAARELAEESKRLFQEVGEAWGLAMALSLLGEATVKRGDPVAARSFLEESVALFRIAGDRQRLVLPIDALGLVALQQGDYAGARARFDEALSLARERGDEPFIADALARLGTVALREGDFQQSARLYQQSLALNRDLGNRDGIAEDLAGLAEAASLAGQPERAAQLLGTVEAVREARNIELPPLRRAEYERGRAASGGGGQRGSRGRAPRRPVGGSWRCTLTPREGCARRVTRRACMPRRGPARRSSG